MNEIIKKRPLVNCHCHSSHSTLDGCSKISDYIKLAKEHNNPALCLTDHGNPSGLYDFYKEVKAAGLKPILGEEFYLSTNIKNKIPSRQRPLGERDKHQTVLIKDIDGYKNFCKLNYLAFTEGYYYKPRIEFDMLFQHKKGLIVTSGCMASMISQFIKSGQEKEAEQWFKKFVLEFGDDFYGEIQFNEINDKAQFDISQREINEFIIRMCDKYGTKLLIGGDTHYAYPEDNKLQDIVINCQRRRSSTSDQKVQESFIHARHLYYHTSEDYFEFNKKFGFNYDEKLIEQALNNSLELPGKVSFEFETGKINFPKYQDISLRSKTIKTNAQLLEELAFEGLLKKIQIRKDRGEIFSNDLIDRYSARLLYELEIIEQKQITDYFLIVQDLINWAKSNDIMIGAARGSAAGALVSYATSITEIDSIQHNLMFERFQNPERTSLPDIDFDVEQGGRERLREYLEVRYGKDAVFGVVTFHVYKAKSALEDASRGLGLDTGFGSVLMSEITKLPELEGSHDLRAFFDDVYDSSGTSYTVKQWIKENEDTIKWADKLLGQCKNLGTHAGGILITPGPIYDYIPVTRGSGEVVTAFKEADGSSKDLSELGLLKLDVLGLKTLNVIKSCINDIKKDTGKDITNDILFINLEDPNLIANYAKGNNLGIFQMESPMCHSLIKMVNPKTFEDICAINAINRPGPFEAFGNLYGKRKEIIQNGDLKEIEELKKEACPFPFMEKALESTYYCMIYQEQLMQMLVDAADFNLGEADNLRRAIAWKPDNPKFHTVKKYFDKLAAGMKEKGYSEVDTQVFVDYCRKFSGYSFNKSHSVSYAVIAMQTLYLKVYYPGYFFSNHLNYEPHENYQEVISDTMANNIEILPPSITKSKIRFTTENGNKVRAGLGALKGFGDKAAEELIALDVSKCENIDEVFTKPFKKVNSKAFQCLIDCGAFDEFGVDREKIEYLKNLYKEKKIATWFSRKRKPRQLETMPDILLDFPEGIILSAAEEVKDLEMPHLAFITKLIPYIKVKKDTERVREAKQDEVLGFSLGLAQKLNNLIREAESYPELNLQSLTTRTSDDDLCYWFLLDRKVSKTKKGKEYLNLELTDKNTKLKAKCWNMIDVEKGKAYISQIKSDAWGFTVVANEYLCELPF